MLLFFYRIRKFVNGFPICADGFHSKMGRNPVSSIDNGRHRRNQLNGRNLERLSKGHRGQFHKSHILLFVHDGAGFSWQVNPRLFLQAKLLKIVIIPVNPQPLPYINKYRIAGIHHSLKKGFPSMSPCFVASDFPVLYNPESGTGKMILQPHGSCLQTGCRSYDFKGRARFICIINGRIPPHPV